MSYLSIEFAVVFILFFLLYWLFRRSVAIQNGLLLVASYWIIGLFTIDFALILAGYTTVIYLLSTGISYGRSPKFWLITAVVVAIGNLALFKYFNFFAPQFVYRLSEWGIDLSLPVAEIIFPIGISFYTFHSISYLVSLYERAVDQRERPLEVSSWRGMAPISFFDFALFLAFFPSVIAGPINRANCFLPQIQRRSPREIVGFHRAFALIILAVIKVYWLSSYVSQEWVKPAFDTPQSLHTVDLILGVYAYAVELYLNFSGYTNLVTGIAILLGFQLPRNFKAPYLATNLKHFWSRWHISLSRWIQDYIYIPLGGSRKGLVRTQINVLIAMVLSGLWHGETFNFLIWGLLHGVGVLFLNVKDHYQQKRLVAKGLSRAEIRAHFRENRPVTYGTYFNRFLTFNYVCLGWIFFRNITFDDSLNYLSSLLTNFTLEAFPYHSLGLLLMILAVTLFLYPILVKVPAQFVRLSRRVPWFLLPILYILILWGAIYLAPSGIPQFIYASF